MQSGALSVKLYMLAILEILKIARNIIIIVDVRVEVIGLFFFIVNAILIIKHRREMLLLLLDYKLCINLNIAII